MPHTIKKSVTVAAPIHKVWAALTNPKDIGAWMSDGNVKVTLRKSGRYAFFGGETSGKFVNGVLGTVYRDIGAGDGAVS